ncbi:hypothetical protein TVAG_388860 [Trichomonas vaginalis G3]|uniref:Thioredoxin domain-containing protein n=1 Tax=Trichomonas vaginalis (strain ATCC PRA-98 / G3) TaxID=412133 RepID=A2DYL8_TRIV3|nr:hypothetical protein TVAGG3_0320750 [Trichomonas vaginalis G3]EAY14553.1 hypothetical protein TVAG_388860 [Trichomonas vaginalis G3]KAI5529279.1 hypothetical protein TVAGG3_0320750 [Trichomonas vaginalis G3]|eukprot:XP_001326776.1 hypothetical protein [Trichomonas vaginalis G3]
MVDNSAKTPFLAVFYTPTCIGCENVEETYESLDITKKKNGLPSMLINCRNVTICKSLELETIPIGFLIDTPKRRYWKKILKLDHDTITQTVLQYSRLNIHRSSQILNNSKEFTSYHLVSQSESDSLLKTVRRAAKYSAKNNEFSYEINNSIEKSTLTAYVGNGICNISTSDNSIVNQFIKRTQFSPFHFYNDEEINEVSTKGIVLIYLADSNRYFVDEFVYKLQKENCDKLIFGFSTPKLSPNLLMLSNVKSSEVPFMISLFGQCMKIYKGRFFEKDANDFINSVFLNSDCGKTFGERAAIKPLIHSESVKTESSNSLARYPFEAILFVLLTLIYIGFQKYRI